MSLDRENTIGWMGVVYGEVLVDTICDPASISGGRVLRKPENRMISTTKSISFWLKPIL